MAVGVYLVILEMLKLRKNFPYGFIQLKFNDHIHFVSTVNQVMFVGTIFVHGLQLGTCLVFVPIKIYQ